MSSISSETITIPERVTGKLPIAYWEIYFTILTDRLAQDFPGYEETERAGIAMGSLQFIACGNAALDSLAVSFIRTRLTELALTFGHRNSERNWRSEAIQAKPRAKPRRGGK